MPEIARRNNAAELDAFETACRRLAGFDDALDAEFVDGFLTALAAGPGMPPVEEWLPALAGDAFERAFADPPDRAQALRALKTRVSVLVDQLDPEWLFDAPDALRLAPFILEWTDELRQSALAEGSLTPEEVARLRTGVRWAEGVAAGAEAFPQRWAFPPEGDEARADWLALWDEVQCLRWGDDDPRWAGRPGPGPGDRDGLIDHACLALQDLRLQWVEAMAPPPTRRVEPAPGRNNPCPCGSGRKFKKCHGAAAS